MRGRWGMAMAARRALAGCESGVVLIEFAVILPVLLLLFLGSYALFDLVSCDRKVAITARTVADLTTRYTTVATTDTSTIMGVSSEVLWPYSPGNAGIRLSEVQVTDSTHAKVIWSQAQNATAYTTGTSLTTPTNVGSIINSTGAYLILAEVTYVYTSPIPYMNFKTMNLSEKVYMSPRVSDSVPLQ